ncbi:hypothetical protein OHT61_03730 [Streptomyces sp. NBC_00178]|uniref:hypothetical protein n=1 Tax=Streptomyces sp. NBC_00178 TaxID=2975672 RepID=UPI002E2D9EE4|nr:hypothetical protein [Streptomyces sp. NBC_00178]
MSLLLVALLSASGCVSVPAGADRHDPVAPGPYGNTPAAQASAVPSAPAAVHDALGRTEGRRPDGDGKKRKQREGARPHRAEAAAPAAPRRAREQSRRPALARPERPRRAVPRWVKPKRTFDMRSVCATGQGVASAGIVDLCRATYGR